MKSIMLLRHGKSSWKNSNVADHDRPLKRRGKNDARRMGKYMTDNRIIPDIILCSTAKRAKDTITFLLESLQFDGEIIYSRNLYHGYPDDYIEFIHNLRNDVNCVMVVGHNPGLEEFLSNLTHINEWLPTTALAQIEIDELEWGKVNSHTQGKLINLCLPRDLNQN